MSIESVNNDTCIGCGQCVMSCPMDVFRLDTLVEDKNESTPCQMACPLGVNQREYINLLKMGMMDEAADVLSRYHPMPAITGRLCPHPCESDCNRNDIDGPVNINSLEQYTGDHILNMNVVSLRQIYKARIAIIGSGPSGLSAAYFLALSGYEVTVFEKNEKPGGLLRSVIPSFRLSEDVLDKQISIYEKMGITFETGVNFGTDVTREQLEKEGYGAFIAATGASKPFTLNVPGSDAEGITNAMEFLGNVKSGKINELSGKVAVIGGGSVALDAARSALRLGADEVSVICLEQLVPGLKDSMLALTEEINDAQAEGINIHPSRGVDSFVTEDSRVKSIKCVECLSVRDEDGMFTPVYGDCVLPQEIDADVVILAIGQSADADNVPEGFATNPRGLIMADKITKAVAPGLFAAGDAVTGPSTVVEALSAGKRTADTVDCFLRGIDMKSALEEMPRMFRVKENENILQEERINRRRVPADECKIDFKDTVIPFNRSEATIESERCLTCGSRSVIKYPEDCQLCGWCLEYCPTDALTIEPHKYCERITTWA